MIVFDLQIGQELEFIEPVRIDGQVIGKGSRVRVGLIEDEVVGAKVMVVMLGREPKTLTLPRHILTLHCLPVRKEGA